MEENGCFDLRDLHEVLNVDEPYDDWKQHHRKHLTPNEAIQIARDYEADDVLQYLYEFLPDHTPSGYHIYAVTSGISRDALKGVLNQFFSVLHEAHHKFPDGSHSGCYILAESHCNYHEYPRHKQVIIDLYYCNDTINPSCVLEALADVCTVYTSNTTYRGLITVGDNQ